MLIEATTLVLPARFNGPPGSANGGYACGEIAALVGDGAEVTLRLPPPLDTPIRVETVEGVTRVYDGDRLVAEARMVDWDLEVPPPPTMDEAADASSRYAGFDHHEFATCFACGTDRDDGLHLWTGWVEGRQMVASPWIAPEDAPLVDGSLAPGIVWAALDCPGAWVTARDLVTTPVVLGRMAARVMVPLAPDRPYLSYAWRLGEDGRKSYAGTAIADEEGNVLAYARQTWITVAR